MKTLLGTALISALLAGTAAQAQEIRPLDATASSQSRIIELGAVPTGVVVLGTIVIGGVVIAIVGASDGT